MPGLEYGGESSYGGAGSTGDPALGGANGVGGAVSNAPYEPPECETPAVGPSPLRRLTHREYDNAVRELLGDQTRPGRSFPADTAVGLFDNTATSQTVPELLADKYLESAVELAENVADVGALTGCDFGGDVSNCVRSFIARFGRRAYRRPLTDEENASLAGVYEDAKGQSDSATGVRAVVASVLTSPNFLFRPEFGDGTRGVAGSTRLTQFEVAARLGSLVWASIPDSRLLDAAAAGQLATPDQVAAQARRMLDDPRARPAVEAFYAQWLGLGRLEATTKDPSVFPDFDDTLKSSMFEETRRFVERVLWEGEGTYGALLTSSETVVNGPLAALYGVKGPADANTWERVALDPSERAGILTQASLLTAAGRPDESSPVKRGKWVRVRLLCQDLPDPPPDIPPLPPPAEGTSTRERFAQHTASPACAGCHSLIDGLGFGLEQYDGIGRVRTVDRGVAVDTTGEVTSTGDIDTPYEGGAELGKLRDSPEEGGTLLDNTVILWVSEFSESNGHASNRLLWFLMGNAGGLFKQGEVIDCRGRATNDLLTALTNAFGVQGTFGNPAYGDGPLTSIYA